MKLIYEGKAKQLFETVNENEVYVHYKNSATAFNGLKYEEFEGKGRFNNEITSLIFQYLIEHGIKTHFIKKVNETDQLCEKINMIPLEVIIRNIATGSMTKRFGIKDGTHLKSPVFELSYKNDALQDPMINEDHVVALEILDKAEIAELKSLALKINELLKVLFLKAGLILVDFKIEFGKNSNNEIVLADEISPDTCRLWDINTMQSFDKDRFRKDLGDFMEGYEEVLRRLQDEIH